MHLVGRSRTGTGPTTTPSALPGVRSGGAIAHAHMTLSIIPHLRESVMLFTRGECMFYGYNRVRFPTIVPVGARIRVHGTVLEAEEIDGGQQLTLDLRIEVEGQERPGCVAQAIWRHYDIDQPE